MLRRTFASSRRRSGGDRRAGRRLGRPAARAPGDRRTSADRRPSAARCVLPTVAALLGCDGVGVTGPGRRERAAAVAAVLGGAPERRRHRRTASAAATRRSTPRWPRSTTPTAAAPGGERGRRGGGLGASAPRVARWLGDIRRYFPSTVVQVMQADAIERLDLARLLLEPEMLEAVEPDVHLVGTLLALNRVMPERSKRAARAVVAKVVADLERRIAQRTRPAVTGALNRAARVNRPRHRDIDWNRTIRANLRHYQPELRHGRAGAAGRLRPARPARCSATSCCCVDQSGSMARLGRLRRRVRRGARVDALAAHVAGRVRHRRRRPDRGARTTRSRCCSAPSWAAAPTSTGRSPTPRA